MRDADSYRSARKRKAKELGITVEQLEARQRLADWAKQKDALSHPAPAEREHLRQVAMAMTGGINGRR